jgi:hypothetical protein
MAALALQGCTVTGGLASDAFLPISNWLPLDSRHKLCRHCALTGHCASSRWKTSDARLAATSHSNSHITATLAGVC